MPYLVKLANGGWYRRGKEVKRMENATVFPHPSAAEKALDGNKGSVLIPMSEIKKYWISARSK